MLQVEDVSTVGISSSRLPSRRARYRMFPPLLRFLLAGYLFFSRPFAYLHVPGTPLFVGEIVLLVGIAETVWIRPSLRRVVAESPILKMLLVFMAWCSVLLVISLSSSSTSKLDALRDSAIWYYGAFAFLVACAASHDATFVPSFLRWFRRVLPWFTVWAPVVIVLKTHPFLEFLLVPGTNIHFIAVKPGDVAASLGMVVTFLWLDLSPDRSKSSDRWFPLLVVLALGGIAFTTSQTRGGFLGAAASLGIVFVLLPHRRRGRIVRSTAPILVVTLVALAIVNPRISTDRREISLLQMLSNVTSIFGSSNQELEGTTEWRKELWRDVLKDSLSSEYLIGGQGFGPNLYKKYRPDNQDAKSETPLRNPHNSHLNIWARSGAVGMILWGLLWAVFFAYLMRVVRAPRHGRSRRDRHLAIWLGATVLAIHVNTFFDPAIEGPHAGIWLWVLVGVAAAVTRRDSHFRATIPADHWRRSPVEASTAVSR